MSDDDTVEESGDGAGFRWRWLAVVPLVVIVALVVLYLLGVLGAPSVGVADAGDWEVTENRTEVVTTVWVRNPNPVGATLGTGLGAAYEVQFNGVTVATGDRSGISLPAGNRTVRLHSYVRNERIPAWWVAYVRANETLRADVGATLRANVGPSPNVTHTVERDRTMFADSRPVVDALSTAADRTSGRYTEEIDLARRAPFVVSALGSTSGR
ncbi:LEA type 2 family protein [Halosimplex aquaticum]